VNFQNLSHLFQAVLIVSVIALSVGHALGQPVLLSYVTSDSMEPTIEPGDGFVAVPTAITGETTPGDIVIYQSTGEGLVTHRVVDETPAGYVTRGDANPVTDQDGGDPHVTEEDIVAKALQVGDTVVTVPGLGTAAAAIGGSVNTVQLLITSELGGDSSESSGLAYLLLVLSLVGYAVETVRDSRRPGPDDGDDIGVSPRFLTVAFTLFVVALAAAAMLVPAGTASLTVISSDPAPDAERVTEPGGTVETTYYIENDGVIPVVSRLETGDDITLERNEVAVSGRERVAVPVTLAAPDETGHYERSVVEYRYLYLLPRSLLEALYEIHPRIPFGAIVVPIGISAHVLGRILVGSESVRETRDRERRRRSRPGLFDRIRKQK
jgi:signal peptidase